MNLIESDVIANGISLHVYQTDGGKRPFIFAHGMSDNGLCYWPFAEKLADQYEIILYDSRYHGKSAAPEPPSTVLDRAHDLADLIDALGLQKPGLIGHSMGAVTIALFAGLYPHVPGCIVLEDPPPFALLAARDDQSGREMWQAFAAANKLKSIEELVELSRQQNPTWPEAERPSWALSKQEFDLNAFNEAYIDVALGQQIVSRITCPVLLVTADPDKGALYPPHEADEWVATLPDARHIHIPGAGHSIRREQPDAFLQAVTGFLQEL